MRATILAAAIMIPTGVAVADTLEDIRADCAAEWDGDFAMQEYCVDRQVKAYNNLVPISRDEEDENLRRSLARCLDDWKTANGYDWAMVEYCYDRQEQAYRRLNPN